MQQPWPSQSKKGFWDPLRGPPKGSPLEAKSSHRCHDSTNIFSKSIFPKKPNTLPPSTLTPLPGSCWSLSRPTAKGWPFNLRLRVNLDGENVPCHGHLNILHPRFPLTCGCASSTRDPFHHPYGAEAHLNALCHG
jgi:hypothetical protein